MKSIEFFGPPGSGKTYYQKKLRKFLINNNFKTYSFEENFYTNYSKINEIGFLNQIKFFLKSKLTDENNYILKLTNYYFDRIIDFEKEHSKIINDKFSKKFLNEYFKIFNKNYKNFYLKKKLLKWLTREIASKKISNKIFNNKMILINSEGIYQRLVRLLLNHKKKDIQNVMKKLKFKPFKSNFIIYVDSNLSKCLSNISNRQNDHHNKNEIRKFYEKSKLIYAINKKEILTIKNNKDFFKTCKKIKKEIDEA